MFKFCFTNAWEDYANARLCKWDVVQFFITHQEGHVASARLSSWEFRAP